MTQKLGSRGFWVVSSYQYKCPAKFLLFPSIKISTWEVRLWALGSIACIKEKVGMNRLSASRISHSRTPLLTPHPDSAFPQV